MTGSYVSAADCIHTGNADATTVARFRGALREWITKTVDVDAQRISDIVLASCEALTNCAEHAYPNHPDAARMTLALDHDPEQAIAEIRVIDHGHWLQSHPDTADPFRGRGLILMRALADTCTVSTAATGTTVSLTFRHCPTRVPGW